MSRMVDTGGERTEMPMTDQALEPPDPAPIKTVLSFMAG
jgi:hypothetical protein